LSRDTEQLVTSSTPIDDADLVIASKAGDIAAFEELVTRYDRKLLRIAQNITHNFDDAQEAVQEINFALQSPYFLAAERLNNRLRKRDWVLAIYRKPNVFQHGAGYACKAAQ